MAELLAAWHARLFRVHPSTISRELARHRAKRTAARVPGTEVYVVAPTQDRSGTSNFLGATREGRFRVERRDLGPKIQAWALDGFPADCVLFALTGPLHDRFPDVVVSGINGGPNLADDWFGSGTIGAARTAAYSGVPAVAVSGLDDDFPGAIEAATSWVVRFVRSDLVVALEPPQYLTVSLPVGPPSNIKGARIVERARGITWGRARPVGGGVARDSVVEWRLQIETRPQDAGGGSDVRAVTEGFIAIVPMRVDEFDLELMRRLRRDPPAIPDLGSSRGWRREALALFRRDVGVVWPGGPLPLRSCRCHCTLSL